MFIYEGIVVLVKGNKFQAAILKLTHDELDCDTIKEREFDNWTEANIWLDDEMSRLTINKGIWE